MTTTIRDSRTKSAKTDKRDKILHDLSASGVLLGECVCWTLPDNRGISNTHQAVVDALKAAGLDEKVAKVFLPAQAFYRACVALREERVIDVLRNDKDEMLFQFSKRQVKDDVVEGGVEFLYEKEVKILLNKTTGALTCSDPDILEKARTELNRCLQARTTSDISNIVNALFEAHADLIPIGTGVFFVPQEYVAFTDKIASFMKLLGRRIRRLSIPKGAPGNEQNVAEMMEAHFNSLLEGLQEAVKDFSLVTRDSTIAAVAERININRSKIEAYATYLQDKREDLLRFVDHVNKMLMVKLALLNQERRTAPVGEHKSNRQRVFECLNGEPMTVNKLCELAGTNTKGIKPFLDDQVNKGRVIKIGDKYRLATDGEQ